MNDQTCKVLLVEDNPVNARLVQQMLKDADGACFDVTHVESLVKGLDLLAREKFELGLLDLSLPDSEGLETFLALRRHAPELPVVILSSCESESLAIRAVEEGAQDYLVKSKLKAADLARAVKYGIIRSRKTAVEPVARQAAEVVTFLGSKGGVGTTTLACLAADCLKRQADDNTLLLSMEMHSGAAGLFMNVESEYTLTEAATNLHRLDAALWKGLVCTSPSQVDVLLPPNPAQFTKSPTADRVRHVLRFARSIYRWIVVDLGTLNPLSLGMLDEVETLYVVTTHDFPALWDASRTLKCLAKLGLATDRVRLVVNRAQKHGALSAADLKKALDFDIHAVLPDDSEALEDALAKRRLLESKSRLYTEVSRFIIKRPKVEPPVTQPLSGIRRLIRA